MDSPSPLVSRIMAMDVIGYIMLTVVLWKVGVPWTIALIASVALGASFGMRGEQTCLCISNKPLASMYSSMAKSPAPAYE
jgi:hypothetical protein